MCESGTYRWVGCQKAALGFHDLIHWWLAAFDPLPQLCEWRIDCDWCRAHYGRLNVGRRRKRHVCHVAVSAAEDHGGRKALWSCRQHPPPIHRLLEMTRPQPFSRVFGFHQQLLRFLKRRTDTNTRRQINGSTSHSVQHGTKWSVSSPAFIRLRPVSSSLSHTTSGPPPKIYTNIYQEIFSFTSAPLPPAQNPSIFNLPFFLSKIRERGGCSKTHGIYFCSVLIYILCSKRKNNWYGFNHCFRRTLSGSGQSSWTLEDQDFIFFVYCIKVSTNLRGTEEKWKLLFEFDVRKEKIWQFLQTTASVIYLKIYEVDLICGHESNWQEENVKCKIYIYKYMYIFIGFLLCACICLYNQRKWPNKKHQCFFKPQRSSKFLILLSIPTPQAITSLLCKDNKKTRDWISKSRRKKKQQKTTTNTDSVCCVLNNWGVCFWTAPSRTER